MVKIRFTRTGRKNYASYRLVAIDSRRKRDGEALEYLGYYLPHEKQTQLNDDRIKYWMSVGAQPSPTVARLLVKNGLMAKKDLTTKTYAGKQGRKVTDRAAAKEQKLQAAAAAAEAAKQAAEAPAEEEVAVEAEVTEAAAE